MDTILAYLVLTVVLAAFGSSIVLVYSTLRAETERLADRLENLHRRALLGQHFAEVLETDVEELQRAVFGQIAARAPGGPTTSSPGGKPAREARNSSGGAGDRGEEA